MAKYTVLSFCLFGPYKTLSYSPISPVLSTKLTVVLLLFISCKFNDVVLLFKQVNEQQLIVQPEVALATRKKVNMSWSIHLLLIDWNFNKVKHLFQTW